MKDMVYELKFFYWDDNPLNDDEVIIAVYSSYELAEKGLRKFAEQPRFKGKEDALFICEYEINEESSTWSEGFFEAGPTFFGIDLMGSYRLKKYEGNEIGIRLKESKQDIYNATMHDYQDYEDCLILRNQESGKMCCFDKKCEKILLETENEEEFLDYLKTNHSIEAVKWRSIED